LHLGFASGPGDAIGDLKGSSESSSDAGGDGGDTEKTPAQQLEEQISSIKTSILKLSGVSQTEDVSKATENAKDEKDKAQQAANTRINNAATQAMANARGSKPVDVKKAFAMEPIILPGPQQNLPIEALNPSTSMIQYAWKVNL
jgi:TolA-binding protein